MKKIGLLIHLILLTVFLMGNTTSNIEIISSSTQNIEGMTHEKVQRNFHLGTQTLIQTYDYFTADFSTGDFEIVVSDSYTNKNYALGTTLEHAENAQSDFDYFTILGGVNGDFFGGSIPVEAYIKDGGVISSGQGFNREFVGFKDNGDVVIGTPTFDGYEILVRDSTGREKIRLPIRNINSTYKHHPYDIYAYFDTYNAFLDEGVNKYIVNATHTIGALPKLYGRGVVEKEGQTDQLMVEDNTFVIMSNNPYLENLVQKDDVIMVQRRLSGDFESVRWGIGGWGILVKDGEKNTNIVSVDPNFRAPRTALGIKTDGSVFFVAVDGRQPEYSDGINLYDLADLMISYGAVQAINLDGGGSTTAVIKSGQSFEVVNSPSDPNLRKVTNSIFIAKRNRDIDRTPYEIPDFSQVLETVGNISVSEGTLIFDDVQGATAYKIYINDQSIEVFSNALQLSRIVDGTGIYNIQIQAIGDGFYFKNSEVSINYKWTYDGPVQLSPPNFVELNDGILTWDGGFTKVIYLFEINNKIYELLQPRFNLNTISLEPGTYIISITLKGDDFLTSNSAPLLISYRVYDEIEIEIKNFINDFRDWFFYKNESS